MDESSKRANSMRRHERTGQKLRKHVLPNAYVYTPISNIKTKDVWTYLLQVDSHWGASNKELVTIYRNADSGDCPLVIDKTTPSCGSSRFGCWVCTVVQKDKSMEGLIDSGEEWMEPLLEIREYLNESRYDKSARMNIRRNGSAGIGPYTADTRKKILSLVLEAQKEIQIEQPYIELINYQELVAIQVIWFRDNIFSFNVADIYNSIFGTQLSFVHQENNIIQEKKLLKKICQDHIGDYELINDLLELQRTRSMLMSKRGINNDFENKLDQYLKAGSN
jgi:DNA sulfur modification protein DndC